jgi:hypothetical protein
MPMSDRLRRLAQQPQLAHIVRRQLAIQVFASPMAFEEKYLG